jgi:hypothetical protein
VFAAAQAAQAAANTQDNADQRPLIFVDVLGFLGDKADCRRQGSETSDTCGQ